MHKPELCNVTALINEVWNDITEFVYLCLQIINLIKSHLFTRSRSIDRVRRNAAHPADVLRLLKQPSGLTRSAVRAADYMDNAIKLLYKSQERRQKRSINATGAHSKICILKSPHLSAATNSLILCLYRLDLISEEDLMHIAELTGCSPRHRVPSCATTPNLDVYRTATSVCNNRSGG